MTIQRFLTISAILLSVAACNSSSTPGESSDKSPSALESDAAVITGDQLTDDYIKLLCQKYDSCSIKAFKDDADCHSRIKVVLEQDPKWKALSLDKTALKLCLKDFESLPCEEFTLGKAPESCQKL